MMRLARRLLIATPLLCGAGALAQVAPDPGAGLRPETQLGVNETLRQGPVGFQLYTQGTWNFDADLDGGGESSVNRLGAGAGIEIEAAKNLIFRVAFDAEWSDYDFSGVTGLIGNDPSPWEDVQTYRIAPSVQINFDDPKWTMSFGGDIRAAYEPGADFADSLTGSGYVAFRYQWTKSFALTFGVGAGSRLEEDVLVLPVLGVEWQIDDKWSFGTRGLGAGITYKFSDQLNLTLRGGYEPRGYRLSDSRGANPGGVFHDDRVPVGLELTWKPAPFAIFSIFAGGVVWQEYRVYNDNGNKLADDESDPAPFIAARATIQF